MSEKEVVVVSSEKPSKQRKSAAVAEDLIWKSEDRQNALVYQVQSFRAYMPSSGTTLQAKFEQVKKNLHHDPQFKDFPIGDRSWTAYQAKFNHLKDDVSKKYGVEKEGANLSGLPEAATSTEKTLYDIIIEINKKKG
jgi:hypothetical protein